jgi:hypothetical protein
MSVSYQREVDDYFFLELLFFTFSELCVPANKRDHVWEQSSDENFGTERGVVTKEREHCITVNLTHYVCNRILVWLLNPEGSNGRGMYDRCGKSELHKFLDTHKNRPLGGLVMNEWIVLTCILRKLLWKWIALSSRGMGNTERFCDDDDVSGSVKEGNMLLSRIITDWSRNVLRLWFSEILCHVAL